MDQQRDIDREEPTERQQIILMGLSMSLWRRVDLPAKLEALLPLSPLGHVLPGNQPDRVFIHNPKFDMQDTGMSFHKDIKKREIINTIESGGTHVALVRWPGGRVLHPAPLSLEAFYLHHNEPIHHQVLWLDESWREARVMDLARVHVAVYQAVSALPGFQWMIDARSTPHPNLNQNKS